MDIRITRWSPDDTCGCVLEYVTDRDDPTVAPVFFADLTGALCPVHSGLSGIARYNAAKGDNNRKNRVDKWLLENLSTKLGEDFTDDAGTVVKVWKKGVAMTYSFSGQDADRVITISVTGINLTNAEKNQVKAFADSTFGVGKVVIQ